MTTEELNKLVTERYYKSKDVLVSKGKEYGEIQDTLKSFKEQVDFSLHQEPTTVAWELMVKHLYSVRRIINEYECEDIIPSQEMIDEKFGDAINYLILIEALFIELKNEKDKNRNG
jgi:hypothetical protein